MTECLLMSLMTLMKRTRVCNHLFPSFSIPILYGPDFSIILMLMLTVTVFEDCFTAKGRGVLVPSQLVTSTKDAQN